MPPLVLLEPWLFLHERFRGDLDELLGYTLAEQDSVGFGEISSFSHCPGKRFDLYRIEAATE